MTEYEPSRDLNCAEPTETLDESVGANPPRIRERSTLPEGEELGALLDSLQPRLQAVAIRITRDRESARDAVQTTFEKVIRHRNRFRAESRQLVKHGHFLVNGPRASIPSMLVKPGIVIKVAEKSRKVARIIGALETLESRSVPQWVEINKNFADANGDEKRNIAAALGGKFAAWKQPRKDAYTMPPASKPKAKPKDNLNSSGPVEDYS